MFACRGLLKISLVLSVSLVLTVLLSGPVAADTDPYLDVAFHPFTLDGDNTDCVPYDDSNVGQTRNCDPVNLVFPGRSWQQVSDLLLANEWSTSGAGSNQWLHYDGHELYVENEQLYKPGTFFGPRYHIRLWQAPGDALVTLAAVHHEDFWHNIDMDWEQAEAAVASALCSPNCEQVYLPAQDTIQGKDGEWREWGNNGSATIIPAPNTTDEPPTITVFSPAADSTVTQVTPVVIQADDDHDLPGALSVQWRVDDGGWLPATYNAVSDTYEATWDPATVADGSHLFQALATDSAANAAGASHNVMVDMPNQSPTARFNFYCNDLTCEFNASTSDDPDGDIAGYAWDFGDGSNGTGATPDHTYAMAGTFLVTLTVTDNEGATGINRQDVAVNSANYLPLVIFDVVCPGLSCDFDASDSSDPDGTIVVYAWDFGDGISSSGSASIISHTYASAGTYSATLTLTDDAGGMATDAQELTVVAPPPATLHVGDLEGTSIIKRTWRADVTITVHDSNEGLFAGATVRGDWRGDTLEASSCTTDDSGTCTVSTAELSKKTAEQVIFTVTSVEHPDLAYEAADNHDPQGDGSGTVIQVNKDGTTLNPDQPQPAAPVAVFTFDCPDLTCTIDGTGSYDPDGGDIVRYDWSFGDGAAALDGNPVINHTYAEAGSWTVVLTVTDDEGETNSQSQTVSVGQSAVITLTAVGYKLRAIQHVDLSWSDVDNVDIYRDGVYLATWSITDGPYTDNLGVKRGGPYTYQVCSEVDSRPVCSDTVTVEF